VTAWPFIDSMNPAADTLALSTTEVDVSVLQPGHSMTVMWRGKPVFIRHRTAEEIAAATDVKLGDLRDPQADADRVQKGHEKYLVTIGVCTHLGCVPSGQKDTDLKGDYAGWFCPCHGSHYDTSGRIRKGPAPKNLEVPPYAFISEAKIKIG
jgi:ubiquinol-cytochrome c reductase iron-sulfur subunit